MQWLHWIVGLIDYYTYTFIGIYENRISSNMPYFNMKWIAYFLPPTLTSISSASSSLARAASLLRLSKVLRLDRNVSSSLASSTNDWWAWTTHNEEYTSLFLLIFQFIIFIIFHWFLPLVLGLRGALGRGSTFDRLPAGHPDAKMSVSALVATHLLNLSRLDSMCQPLGNIFS